LRVQKFGERGIGDFSIAIEVITIHSRAGRIAAVVHYAVLLGNVIKFCRVENEEPFKAALAGFFNNFSAAVAVKLGEGF
jgi:hypothetical protein